MLPVPAALRAGRAPVRPLPRRCRRASFASRRWPTPDREIAATPAHLAELLDAELPAVQAAHALYAEQRPDARRRRGLRRGTVWRTWTRRSSTCSRTPLLRGDAATALASRDGHRADRVHGAPPVRRHRPDGPDHHARRRARRRGDPASWKTCQRPRTTPSTLWQPLRPPEPPAIWGSANYSTYVRAAPAAAGALPEQLAGLVSRLGAGRPGAVGAPRDACPRHPPLLDGRV